MNQAFLIWHIATTRVSIEGRHIYIETERKIYIIEGKEYITKRSA